MAKTFFKILLGVIVVGVIGFGVWIYMITSAFNSFHEDTWQIEKQLILKESFSPDSTSKIGLYNYDSGALGYTAIQMSVVDSSEGYPLTGNILMINRIPSSIKWYSNDSVSVVLDTSNTPGFRIDPNKNINGIKFNFNIQ